MSARSPYNIGLEKTPANYQPLSPINFLERAAAVFPNHTAIIYGELKQNYQNFYQRSKQLASALSVKGIQRADTVSVMLANTPPMLEAHYGVPMSGAVLHTINTRLDAASIAYQLDHADTKILIFDRAYSLVVKQALSFCKAKPLLIDYNDTQLSSQDESIAQHDYEAFIATGDIHFNWQPPQNEWDAISLNYTSGTTGDPKGVVYHYRGAYLLAQGNALTAFMPKHAVYLWTLPMFHCNGWCFPWTISAICGTHVCLREVRPKQIWDALAGHRVDYLCGAPIVMSTILGADENDKRQLDQTVEFLTAAAPPPKQVMAEMKLAGFNVTHLYGLTETYGPAVVNDWNHAWDALEPELQLAKNARQGVRYLPLEGLEVMDPNTMQAVPRDGKTIGEIMFRGNVVMKGYFKDKVNTQDAFRGGWFHSGDLGVMHEDGYIQLKDRLKDIIISGGENISSIEIEDVLYKHPDVAAVAVVAMPDNKWGETPCAFIELVDGCEQNTKALEAWCRENMAGFKVPKAYIFSPLVRTSTGKIQKVALREHAKQLQAKQRLDH